MEAGERKSVQGLTVEYVRIAAVKRVAQKRVADVGEVDPDLMGPPCQKPYFDQRGAGIGKGIRT